MGLRRTYFNAVQTNGAGIMVAMQTAVIQSESGFRATMEALATADAFFRNRDNLELRVYAFGVMAPETIQGASFEKNGCPDVRAVMQGVTFYCK